MSTELTTLEVIELRLHLQDELGALKDIFALNTEIVGLIAAVEGSRDVSSFWSAAEALGQRLAWEGQSPDPIHIDQLELFKKACDGPSFFVGLVA